MSGVVDDPPQEFWRPPAIVSHHSAAAAAPAMVDACGGCGAEFMVGARFCHACGSARGRQAHSAPTWTRYLDLQTITQLVGLSTASLVAFLFGLGCLVAAIAVGYIFSIQTFNDFQAVQFFRVQWLLGAVAAFLAGILLKRSGAERK